MRKRENIYEYYHVVFNELVKELKKRKRMDVTDAAIIAGYSPGYFRGYVLPLFLVIYKECVDKYGSVLEWKC